MIKGPIEPTRELAISSFMAKHPKCDGAIRELTGWYGYFLDTPEPVPVNVAKFPKMTPDEMLVRK